MDKKGLKYMKKILLPVFRAIFLAEFWVPLPPKHKLVWQTKLVAFEVTICIWKIRTV